MLKVAVKLYLQSARHKKETFHMKPIIVLVHGAFKDAASWAAVAAFLRANQYRVHLMANPLRSVAGDSASLAGFLQTLEGPIVLVGHSYGGVLVSNAGKTTSGVQALVFVAAMAPDFGESVSDLGAKFSGSAMTEAIIPVPLPDGTTDLYLRADRYHGVLAADLPESAAIDMAASQRPGTLKMMQDPSGYAAWRDVPSYFVYGDADMSMPPALHAFLAHRAGALEVVVVPGASHDLLMSKPREVAALIERAAMSPPKTRFISSRVTVIEGKCGTSEIVERSPDPSK
jgi:pimeloyl-ACP methyl ester carboxylesterase